jgi:hypothetical protein
MRKLIRIEQEVLVKCDNPRCGFKVINESKDPNAESKEFINKDCPDCGENLLTQEDYDRFERLMRKINWINKWFGWLNFSWLFEEGIPKEEVVEDDEPDKPGEGLKISVSTHKEVSVKTERIKDED